MKKLFPVLVLAATFTMTTVIAPALAEEKKIVGPITKVQLDTPKAGSATITVKEGKTGTDYTMVTADEATLDKLKSRKMDVDNEVRAKFDTETKAVKSIKRTAGCD